MGQFLTSQVEPSAPPTNQINIYADSADSGRPKIKTWRGDVIRIAMADSLNFLRNSDLRYAQRQAPGTLTTRSNTTGRTGTADGWCTTNENASVQYIRTDSRAAPETGLLAPFYGTISKITSTGKIMMSQMLEGVDCAALRGRTVRFQVKLKASASKTLKIAVLQLNSSGTLDTAPATFISAFGGNGVDPTLGTNVAFLAPKSASGTPGSPAGGSDNVTTSSTCGSCAVTTAWQRFGICVDVPSNARNLFVMIWTDTQFAAADSFSWTEASLTDGMEIQEYAPLDHNRELARCQRYYTKTYEVDTDPTMAVLPGALRAVVTKAATALG